jgi:acetyltransferase-like isoleucine patch superfamily enzyme
VHILSNTIVNNSTIESYSYVGKNCIIQNTQISKFCSIANDVCIGLGSHPLTNFSTSPIFYRKKNPFDLDFIDENLDFEEYKQISIGPDVWIGSRVIILDGINIGTGAVIAANSVVTKNVAPYAIVAGVPAKLIRFRFNEAIVQRLLNSKWWELDLNDIKSFLKFN